MARNAAEAMQGIEYSVYTFEKEKGDASQSKWAKRDTKKEMAEAIASAENLFNSGQYTKVEVKQKYFDKKKDRNVDVTLKVFSGQNKKEINIFVILLFAIACGAAAFTATLYLTP